MAEAELNSNEMEDSFYLYGPPLKRCNVKLSLGVLSISLQDDDSPDQSPVENKIQLIAIDDIYGCLCMKDKKDSIRCHLIMYLYSLRALKGISGVFSTKGRLHRSQTTLTYAKFADFKNNFDTVTRWYHCIKNAIYTRRKLPLDIVMTRQYKRMLVFVNPAGGAGKAHRLVMERVVGIWSEAELTYHLVLTEYAGYARDYVQSIELADWCGIILASGDGLIFEVINGLMSRNDWQEALKLPIGHLPCGSGNGFITNVIRHSKQPIMKTMEQFVVQAAVLAAIHDVIPFDLAVVDTCDGHRLFSFLCIEWGIVADADCESEKYRFLGENRFTIEIIKRILQPRTYNGYIDYIPHEVTDNTEGTKQTIPNVPIAQLHRHLLPLNESIPTNSEASKWRRIDGPFAYILITSKASISKGTVTSSQSTLSDGYLTLQFIRMTSSVRTNLVKAFTKISDGRHFDYDFVEWMPIRAFRIVPSDANGNLRVDGEYVPYGPIQGEILPSVARCMGKEPKVNQVPLSA